MAIPLVLKSFLSKNKIKFKTQKHQKAYTAQEIAASEHVPGKQLAKCVLVNTDKGFCLAVLPAIHLIDLSKLKKLAKAKKISIANESDIKKTFPGIEVGAMPPFGNLYKVDVISEKSLSDSKEIVCNAGTHTETMSIAYKDFERVVKPKIGTFGVHVAKAKKKRK
jgi:Ala-tRNA(Pro) deacylase